MLGLEQLLDRKPGAALRWPAPAGRDGPGDRARAEGLPDGRAALEPRRQAARADARLARAAARAPRRHHGLRHPRPDGGDDPRRRGSPCSATACSSRSTGRSELYDGPANVFVAALHRHPGDESGRGHARRRHSRVSAGYQPPSRTHAAPGAGSPAKVILGIRPEAFEESHSPPEQPWFQVTAGGRRGARLRGSRLLPCGQRPRHCRGSPQRRRELASARHRHCSRRAWTRGRRRESACRWSWRSIQEGCIFSTARPVRAFCASRSPRREPEQEWR